MIRAITFIPASGGTEGLTYVERASRNRSLHVLLQDRSFKGSAAAHPVSRRNFLRNAYREIISRYVSFGRIEHPLPLVRSLVRYFDQLSRRVDCRVDDFEGIGFYALFQDGETFYLLTSREGRARVRTGRGFEPLGRREIGGVTELPVETARAQKELFSQDLKDFLSLYRVVAPTTAQSGVTPALDFSLGGSGEEMDSLLEALDQPGVIETGISEKAIPLNLIRDKMMFVRFDGLLRARDFYGAGQGRKKPRKVGSRPIRVAFSAVASLALISLGVLYLSERLGRPGSHTATEFSQSRPAPTGQAGTSAAAALPEGAADRPQNPEVADEPGFRFAVAWDKSYNQPVTSTPILDGGRVIFGSRDRNLYALDRINGNVSWRYRAADGIGASPALCGQRVIGADYQGNVFALGAADGHLSWKRKLPGKVVSSPCVGGAEVVVGCYNGAAYALSTKTGKVRWRVATGGRIRGTCAFADGRFFVPSYDGSLYAVKAGSVAWRTRLGGAIDSSPAVDGNRVVVGAANGGIYGLEASTGHVVWMHRTGSAVKSFVAIIDGKAYAGSNDNCLYCLDAASGTLVWKAPTDGIVLGRAAVAGEYVLFPSYDGFVYCLNARTGERVDRFRAKGPVFSSPAIGEGQAYFGDNSGKFYCLDLHGGESS
jgi:outer membrane protein assembly factor BamB